MLYEIEKVDAFRDMQEVEVFVTLVPLLRH